ncbi:MAG: hypothetical protein ACETWM_13500 [Candidatus Lokiarchaeia archaeon]
MKRLESNLHTIRNLLKKYFKLVFERGLELFFRNIELTELSRIDLKGYVSDSILESMVRLEEGVYLFVSFFSDYVKSATLWFQLFCELLRAFGTEEFLKILFKQIELDDVIEVSKIDEDYLKFQVRTSLDLYLNDSRLALLSTYRKARDLPKVVYYTRSEFAKRLIEVMEKQNEDWLKILDGIYSFYENTLLKENLEKIIKELKNIIYYFIEMAEKLQIAQEFIIPYKSWKDLLLEDIQSLGSRVEEIRKEVSVISEYRIKYYESAINACLFLLRMLWGNEELARNKFENFARTKISMEELLPKEFKLDDLSFGLIWARQEFNLVRQSADVLKEKIHVLEESAYVLGSQALESLYEETLETIREYDTYWEELYKTLLTIQDLTVKTLEHKQ